MERLQKVIANAGITSRRKAEKLIQEGKVTVNGKVVTELGVKVSGTERIEVEGIQLTKEEYRYFLFYKPRGTVSAVTDDKGRTTVADYFADIPERLYPVGRLDYDTSGLLLMTNDGDFANLLMHPKNEVSKTYIARIKGIPEREVIRQLERGVVIDGRKTAPAKVKVRSSDKAKDKAIVEITIHEGRNRQVRKMFEAVGFEVQKLSREEYSFLNLRGLNAGERRELSHHEVKQLKTEARFGKNKK
ncbi:rRNA pseudouridine synthase [Listeria monocytogenes]|uniref:pseudouridine synthase n=1 Tax=Listeria monocytogenes TaxID=1639 RepID=UPI0008757638|nr:pseudouridine synthase [Listeria monocytogenes]EAG6100115.1 rRNA pseudouridine synthase [Listeria monocytogenes]EKZ1597728.1 rRNA pseudouridine synthase [Listeria monocytogenes]EKZ1609487.1 rRNA pseudouridine synthase [Listeria monocytogenes]EKZ1626783.1 rRNA pseudouridine synthase [Listeria monocytogenes]OFG63754.1 pseudouridine synthase [Listeria monocytogenes]